MPFLWVSPLCLSAIFDHPRRPARRRQVACYSVATAFFHAATMGGITPRDVDLFGTACFTLFLFGPVHLAVAAVLESVLLLILRPASEADDPENTALAHLPTGQLPGGYKQRLAMAAALMHGPEILFLDEPTSGADPSARREFWRRITALADQGVTVIVTTHFMEEAEYCDRVAILDAGKVLAQGTPAEIRARAVAPADREPTMEDAFIAIVEEARRHDAGAAREVA